MVEIVGLQQRVGEFGEGQALGRVLDAASDVLLGDHFVDREELAHVAQELEEVHGAQPVVVVDQQGGILPAVEADEVRQLLFDAFHVVPDLIHRQQIAFVALHRRVADHARAAAGQHDGPVPEPLQPGQPHQRDQMSDVQAVRGGVEAHVSGDHALAEQFPDAAVVRRPVDEAARAKHLKRIFRHAKSNPFASKEYKMCRSTSQ